MGLGITKCLVHSHTFSLSNSLHWPSIKILLLPLNNFSSKIGVDSGWSRWTIGLLWSDEFHAIIPINLLENIHT